MDKSCVCVNSADNFIECDTFNFSANTDLLDNRARFLSNQIYFLMRPK